MPSCSSFFLKIRCLLDDVAKGIRCLVAFVTQLGNIASPSYCLREAKPSDGADDHTTDVRCSPDLIR